MNPQKMIPVAEVRILMKYEGKMRFETPALQQVKRDFISGGICGGSSSHCPWELFSPGVWLAVASHSRSPPHRVPPPGTGVPAFSRASRCLQVQIFYRGVEEESGYWSGSGSGPAASRTRDRSSPPAGASSRSCDRTGGLPQVLQGRVRGLFQGSSAAGAARAFRRFPGFRVPRPGAA